MQNEKDKSENGEIHPMQKLFDRPFLLLIAGISIMLAFYTLWGMWEISSLKMAPLP